MRKKYIRYAEAAIKHIRSKLKYGSNTKKDSEMPDWDPARLFKLRKEVMQNAISYALEHDGRVPFLLMATLNYQALDKWGFGNCGEQAQSAFIYLKNAGVAPIDFCQTTVGGHNLLVIGRSSRSDTQDIRTWGEDAIICDPWAEKIYPVSSFYVMQSSEHEVRYPDICYNADSPPHYLSGELRVVESFNQSKTSAYTSPRLFFEAKKEISILYKELKRYQEKSSRDFSDRDRLKILDGLNFKIKNTVRKNSLDPKERELIDDLLSQVESEILILDRSTHSALLF